jgi:4'-phosphopantetheinyl transferase
MIERWPEWSPANGPVVVHCGEVHVFRARLASCGGDLESFAETLSSEERARAARFAFVADKNRFVAAHGYLRALLGSCLAIEPREIAFERTPRGKPRLAAAHGAERLRFNMSTSRDVALYALSLDREVGVDVEYRDAAPVDDRLVAAALPERMRAIVSATPDEGRNDAFYDCWTRVEACGKALGSGIIDFYDEWLGRCTLFDCVPEPLYAAACAVEGTSATAVRHMLVPAERRPSPR